ncbi:MAG: hypothetical protein ACE5GJ_14990, partial [Gemmatimonadota bacterium]
MHIVTSLLFLLNVPPTCAARTTYHLRYPEIGSGILRVELALSGPVTAPAHLVIPRAVPMGYANVRYDRFVSSVRAWDAEGKSLAVTREEGPRWSLGKEGEGVARVTYTVDVGEMERILLSAADASRARPGYVGVLGYSVFGYVDGCQGRPLTLEVTAPAGWPVFSTLAPAMPPGADAAASPSPAPDTLRASAPRFYDLADGQVLMGPDLQVARLDAAVPLYLAVYAEAGVDLSVIGELARRAMNRVVAYFDSRPLKHYTVVQEYLRPLSPDHEYGFSMEHMESGTFFLGTDRAITRETPAAQRERTLANFVHHFAHSWVPKRSYGEGYFPFQWELAPLLETIWLSEGFVRYLTIEIMDDLAAQGGRASRVPAPSGVRARPGARAHPGARSRPGAYRDSVLASYRRALDRMPAFLNRMSLVELSRTGSTTYGEDFRVGRSLFMRGALMAGEMDDTIRAATDGRRRFRDVLRYLVAWSAENRRAYSLEELPALFRQATGVDVEGVYRRWMGPYGTDVSSGRDREAAPLPEIPLAPAIPLGACPSNAA